MTAAAATEPIGFIGLGVMGQPMALNLAVSGVPLVVWNRSAEKTAPLRERGATAATSVHEVFERCPIVIAMLADGDALDGALGRDDGEFGVPVAGRTLVNMATPSPAYSRELETAMRAAGGAFVEAPVSGSRGPAEAGELVAMLAGDSEAVERARPLLRPMTKAAVLCGAIPNALVMKLAINLYMHASVVALAEAVQFANAHGLDLARFQQVLDAGSMASPLARTKAAKLAERDFAVEASLQNACANATLIAEAARAAGIDSPLLEASLALYGDAALSGLGDDDMIAVLRVLEARAAAAAR